MDVSGRMEIIRELCSFERRLAGTDAERRAANRMAERLSATGHRTEVEPTYVHPQYGLVHAAHCLLGFAGSLVSIALAPLGFFLVLLAATSMYLDLNYRLYIIRSLFFRRGSQNVLSRGRHPHRKQKLILCAHLDAARTGTVFAASRARRLASLERRLGVALGPFRILFWSLALLLPILGARMAGVESDLLSLLQLPPTLVLLVGVFALVDIELSSVVPGANDNASGVATAISLATELEAEPTESLDVWVLLTGAEECQQEGMRAFFRAHRDQFDPESTTFLCLDAVGRGDVRYELTAGWVISYDLDRRLAELAEAIAASDREGPRHLNAAPLRHGVAADSLPPRLRGYRALAITCLDEDGHAPDRHLATDVPEKLDEAALERAHAFALALIRALDRDLSRAPGTPARPARRDRVPAPAASPGPH